MTISLSFILSGKYFFVVVVVFSFLFLFFVFLLFVCLFFFFCGGGGGEGRVVGFVIRRIRNLAVQLKTIFNAVFRVDRFSFQIVLVISSTNPASSNLNSSGPLRV